MKKDITFEQAQQAARQLVDRLKDKAKKKPKLFVENYGGKELRKFEDEINTTNLSYADKSRAIQITHEIHDFSPFM